MPSNWLEKPCKAPPAQNVIRGYLEAFDPDALVQLSAKVPDYIAGDLALREPERVKSKNLFDLAHGQPFLCQPVPPLLSGGQMAPGLSSALRSQ